MVQPIGEVKYSLKVCYAIVNLSMIQMKLHSQHHSIFPVSEMLKT